MAQCLAGRVAVVTGAGGGIGRGIALAMAAEGARVVVNDLGCAPTGEGADASLAGAVVREIESAGGEAVASTDSVASMQGAERLVAAALDRWGRIDVLVNNAGITRVDMIWDMDEAGFDAVIATNLKGVWACMRAAAPHMIERRHGRIVNFSSDMSLRGGTGVMPYSASKAGVLGLTITGALELGPFGITVNAIWPGARSRFREAGRHWAGRYRLERPPETGARRKLRDLAPEDVAPIVVHLARDEASGINAQVFRASAGDLSRVALASDAAAVSKDGRWTPDELLEIVPRELAAGVENPAPASDDPVWRWML